MKCDYCDATEDVHTLVDRELGPDIHICLNCWESGQESRLSLRMLPVETPLRNKFPRKTWELDPRFHTPGWAERRLKELEEEKSNEQIRQIVREEVRAGLLDFFRTLATLNGWVTPGEWMKPKE